MGADRRPPFDDATAEVAFIGDHQPDEAKSFWTEARLFLELAIPTSFLGLGFILSPLLTASYVGLRFGPIFLSAFTLGNLTGNLCTFSLMSGLFSASDTLAPQAFGVGDYREVGLIAIRGVFIAVLAIFPINVLLVLYLEDILVYLGQDPVASMYAAEWYRIFVWALPFFVIFQATWKFLAAQHKMRPLMNVSIFCCCTVLPLSLEYLTKFFGFRGSAMAYVCFQASQCILLLFYLAFLKPHVQGTWPGFAAWKEALQVAPLLKYLSLGAGGILCQSEWVYWEALGLIVGNMGVVALSAHTIPNQMIMIMCMIPFSFGVSMTIRMGHVLPTCVKHTQRIVTVTTLISMVLFLLVSVVLYVQADAIFSAFTTDEDVLDLVHSIWWKVCLFNANVSLFGLLTGIATGLGMQWTLGAINFIFLWIFGVPITYYFAVLQGQGLAATWTWINAPYSCMNICLIILFFSADWHKVQAEIKKQDNGASSPEGQKLLDSAVSGESYGSESC
eukprot:Nitzschia sp. Nitz4//scaffold19_size178191//98844//100449//NITZ4_001982-RA/size178191-augustus-gene-0.107-mRNA-1//-1//CDS//3329540696//4434//frame0